MRCRHAILIITIDKQHDIIKQLVADAGRDDDADFFLDRPDFLSYLEPGFRHVVQRFVGQWRGTAECRS